MARARNIKPGFFSNDELADLPALTRLLFIGLWTIADRSGRLEDRPKRIKAEVMPYDDCDVEAMLAALAGKGFIRRYDAAGRAAIQIVTWDKHQNPHIKEADSTIQAPCSHGAPTEEAGKAEEPKPEVAGLIPDSGFLIPDSNSVPNGTGGKPPKLTDPKEIIFGYGLSLLVNAGTPEKNARSFLGGRASEYSDAELVDVLRDCAKAKTLQPLEWIAKAMPPKGSAKTSRRPTSHTGLADKQYTEGVTADGTLA